MKEEYAVVDQLFQLHNKVRQNPKSFIPVLNQRLKHFNGQMYTNQDYIIKTNQGVEAVYQAIQALQVAQPLNKLTWSYPLHIIATQHSSDLGQNGILGHQGSDGATLSERVQRYCNWYGHIAQSLQISSVTPQQIIANILIDDGLQSRGHRKNFLSKQVNYLGIGTHWHKHYSKVTVLTYAMKIEPKFTQQIEKNPQTIQIPLPIEPQSAYKQASEKSIQSRKQDALKQLQKLVQPQQEQNKCNII